MSPNTREAAWGYVFIGPWLIGLVLFTAGPMIVSMVLSFTDFDLVHPDSLKFIGLDNYARMATDPNVLTSVLVTFKFAAVVVPLTMIASLGFAVLLNSPRLFGRNILRTLVYMPIQIPLVAGTLVWIGFLNPETGWMNAILEFFGIPGPDWLNSTTWIYPGPVAHRPVGDRQLHAHQHRRPPVGPDRDVRGGADRRRREHGRSSAGSRSR